MRTTKLMGILLLVAAVFTATRGTGWHVGYIVGGGAMAFLGLVLVTKLPANRFRVRPPRVEPTPSFPSPLVK